MQNFNDKLIKDVLQMKKDAEDENVETKLDKLVELYKQIPEASSQGSAGQGTESQNIDKFMEFKVRFDSFTQNLLEIINQPAIGGKKKAHAAGPRRKVKGGAEIGATDMIYNTGGLILDNHPPASIVGSPEVNMVQYAPAAFSAGMDLNPDVTAGIANPYRELLTPNTISGGARGRGRKAAPARKKAAAKK